MEILKGEREDKRVIVVKNYYFQYCGAELELLEFHSLHSLSKLYSHTPVDLYAPSIRKFSPSELPLLLEQQTSSDFSPNPIK